MKFIVLRRHYGDKLYERDDERYATEADVAHLVAGGVLKKAATPAKNKAAPKPRNKAD